MKTYLLDTSILIALFSRQTGDRVQKIMKKLGKKSAFYICGMVLGEFYAGIDRNLGEHYSALLVDYPYFSSAKPIYENAGLIAHELRNSGRSVPLDDCIIAQTAKYYNAILITADADFLRFPGLKVKFYKLP